MRSTRRVIEAAACGLLFAMLMPAVAGADGEIVAWGSNWCGQCDVPAPNTDFVAVAAGDRHSLGLKADGSIVAWGNNSRGQIVVPEPNTGFTAVAAGGGHSLGIKGYPRGDLDHDRDIDLHDFAGFANCHLGPDVPFPAGCNAADLDPDGDADLADFGKFRTLFTGPR